MRENGKLKELKVLINKQWMSSYQINKIKKSLIENLSLKLNLILRKVI